MFATGIEASIATVTAGSPDTFTLADVAGAPNFNDAFGGSGSRDVSYMAIEFTDSTRAEIKLMQWGIGSIDLSTLVLTQLQIKGTWNPAGPTYDITAPSELSFTAGASTTRVTCAPLAETSVGIMFPGTGNISGALGASTTTGIFPLNTAKGNGTFACTADVEYWRLIYWPGCSQIDQVTQRTGSATTGNCKLSWYECGPDGLPGARIKDFGSFATGGNGTVNVASVSGFCPPPGWYWECQIFDAAITCFNSCILFGGPAGMNSSSNIIVGYTRSGSYSTGLPGSGATSSPTAVASAPLNAAVAFPCISYRMAA